MSDRELRHPGLILSEEYIQSLRMPVESVARIADLQIDLMQTFFKGACDLTEAQAKALEGVLGTWWPAQRILDAQREYRENNLDR